MYTALYRKYRPMTFDDVVSQPHITATLSKQIAEGKTAHAYLFTGSRGTGKTTCARIFAKAINCRNPRDGKPCLECDICHDADGGILNDIIEIDAASNTGVEDIRDLRESAVYTPELCRYKVYIIDEVHMLSNQAFNALLKIMEEPPEHVKFILATTEIHKVPATVISRCQRFDFRRIRQEDIIRRLKYIAKNEGADISDEAAAAIARISDGAMRDALSLLDQCIACSDNITADTVSSAAGIAGTDSLFAILDGIADKNAAEVLRLLNELYSGSKDMSRLCEELIYQLRNIMLIKTAPQNTELLNCLPCETERLEALASKLELETVLSHLDCLQRASEAMIRSVSKRTELEMALIKLCCVPVKTVSDNSSSDDISALIKRIAILERELEDIKRTGIQKKQVPSEEYSSQTPPAIINRPQTDNSIKDDMLKPFSQWDEVLERLTEVNPGCAGALRGSTGRYCKNILLIEVQSEFFLNLFKKPENASSLREVVKQVTGQTFSIRARCVKEQKPTGNDKIAELIEQAKKADIPFDIN